ncbi:MAG: VCBS repeat-containing protein [Deferribacteres bacterium]|nr:VCBS repeat-containing protein [Deferribacteres bacterium]
MSHHGHALLLTVLTLLFLFNSHLFSQTLSDAIRVGDGGVPDLDIEESTGYLHIVHHSGGVKYTRMNADGDVLIQESVPGSGADNDEVGWKFGATIGVDPTTGEPRVCYRVNTHDDYYDIYLISRLSSGSWSTAKKIVDDVRRAYAVRVDVDDQGITHVVHGSAGSDGSVYGPATYLRIDANGDLINSIGNLNLYRADDHVELSCGPNNEVHLVLSYPRETSDPSYGGAVTYYRSYDGGNTLRSAGDIHHSDATLRNGNADIFVDGNGVAHFAYGSKSDKSLGGVPSVRYARWENGHRVRDVAISDAGELQEWHHSLGIGSIATTRDGNFLILTYRKSDTGSIRYRISRDGGGTWSEPEGIGGSSRESEGRNKQVIRSWKNNFYIIYPDGATVQLRKITMGEPPVANAGGPYSGSEGTPVAFDASASKDPDGKIVNYRWDWDGDGNWDFESENAKAEHTYPDDFSGNAILAVVDDEGFSGEITFPVTIANVAPQLEVASSFSALQFASINLSASANDVGVNDTLQFFWDLDNNGTFEQTGNVISASFSTLGEQPIQVKVSDGDGGETSKQSIVKVIAGAPLISEVQAIDVDTSSVKIFWRTHEPADAFVEYGTTANLQLVSDHISELETTHTISLFNLLPNTEYFYRVISKNSSGNESVSDIYSFQTKRPDTAFPEITSVAVTEITSHSARVTWSTDEIATSQVEYGQETTMGTYVPMDTAHVLSHSILLYGLESGVEYFFRALSVDANGNKTVSERSSFVTQIIVNPGNGPIKFQNIAPTANIVSPPGKEGWGHGVACADYNNDGFTDIYIVNYDTVNTLFINEGNSTYTEQAGKWNVSGEIPWNDRGISAADYNNDGFVDIYLNVSGGYSQVFRNDGTNKFTEVSSLIGVSDNGQAQAALWGDLNNDGLLDLISLNFRDQFKFFLQTSAHNFLTQTAEFKFGAYRYTIGGAVFDADGDGDLDVFISRGTDDNTGINYANLFYINNGNNTFSEKAGERGVGLLESHGQGVTVGDYDNDGDFDFFVCNSRGSNTLFRNNGNAYFSNVTSSAGLQDFDRSTGCNFADFDNDGWLDLAVLNFGKDRLFRNNGDGTFTEQDSLFLVNNNSYGSCVTDFDQDGDVDLFVVDAGQKSALYDNLSGPTSWLVIKPEGRTSNRDAIGAEFELYANGMRQKRAMLAADGFVSGSIVPVHFGLGPVDFADSLIIHWPAGGTTKLVDVASNQRLHVIEGEQPAYIKRHNDSAITPPVFAAIPVQMTYENAAFHDLDLQNYTSDGDNSLAELIWFSYGNRKIEVRQQNSLFSFSIAAADSEWAGSEIISFVSTDPKGYADTTQVTFTVVAVNDPPVIAAIPDQEVSVGETFADIDFTPLVSDVDNSINELTLFVVGINELNVNVDGLVAKISKPKDDWVGADSLTFIIRDPAGAFASVAAVFRGKNTATSVQENTLPEKFAFHQNYPNPFNPQTTIAFDLMQSGDVNITIYSITGRVVGQVVDAYMHAGSHKIVWDATAYASGTYLMVIQVTAEQKLLFRERRKVLLIR